MTRLQKAGLLAAVLGLLAAMWASDRIGEPPAPPVGPGDPCYCGPAEW